MVVVSIIGMSTLAFAPGIGRAIAERRVSTAARELIRIGRRARSDTFGFLRAHLIWINPATGVVQLMRGSTNSCTLTVADWPTVQAACVIQANGSLTGPNCLESMVLSTLTKDSRIYMYEELLSGTTVTYQQTARAICYAPNGIVYYAAGADLAAAVAAPLTDANNATVRGGFVYTLHKGGASTASPGVASRVHRVLFPLGGTARSLR
ncbi:MAG: hypothetical protein JWN48_142 [Myxococcaceae bacterium]|nr:hypothetical protein [Myxococcaceae bacterium]